VTYVNIFFICLQLWILWKVLKFFQAVRDGFKSAVAKRDIAAVKAREAQPADENTEMAMRERIEREVLQKLGARKKMEPGTP